ncbi:MAG TPA: response regulator transcription factor, partial [Solirubrobacterales bacterium]|nr:response regulator transcription factor [Solirubrobacterales bacterium]
LTVGGEPARASGWLGRAQRLLDRQERDCAERGYLLIPALKRQQAAGELEAAGETAAEAVRIAERFGDRDLFALFVHEQGRTQLALGNLDEGLRLLDEAMVAVVGGELSPIVTGLLYCSVIDGCQEVRSLRRAREWTEALTSWCERQPDMVAFTGRCLVHRAEIMQLDGAWSRALDEAGRARERFARAGGGAGAGQAAYRQAEVHRLRGEFAAAERAYREASRFGWEPLPGLALLRLAQGEVRAADAAIARAVDEATGPPALAELLPAQVEIALAAGQSERAREACERLQALAAADRSGVLGALSEQARGAVALAAGEAREALLALRRACEVWRGLEAPYELARVRVLVAQACRALGDDDGSSLELDAARDAFAELGAAPDLAVLDALAAPGSISASHGLTPRELEVLRLLAGGDTNRAIAERLVVSRRTVDRHVSNIYAKLRVPSRAAATAYAYEHGLI